MVPLRTSSLAHGGPLKSDNRLFRFDHKTPQRLVGAVALLAAAYTLFAILWPLRYSLLATWGVIELIFYVLYWRPRYAELNEQPHPHMPADVDGSKTFQRFLKFCNDLPKGVDYRAYFSGWFKGADFGDIKRENAEDFMAYGFWYRSRQQMRDIGKGAVPSQMVDQLEATWGIKFAPGFNPDLQFMGHLWEPLNASFRPLAFYLCTEGVGWFARTLLKRWGFEHHKHNGLSYFTLNMPSPKATALTHTRATSSSTLADLAAAAAVPGVTALTVSGHAAADPLAQGLNRLQRPASSPHLAALEQQLQQQCPLSKASASNASSGSLASSPSSTSSASSASSPSSKAPSRTSSGLLRSKSSPFEAGPPDWSQFVDPTAASTAAGLDASAAASKAAATLPAASAAATPEAAPRASRPASAQRQHQPHASAGLGAHAALRHLGNPLQGALSEGLGSADTPVLFLHGVGGLPAYLEMILHVIALGHPVIVVEFRGVSMRLGKVFVADEVADTVVGVLDKLGVREACVVGHSYGTFIAGYLARRHRRRVHTLCLIDPVCFGMFMPHLLYNFLYRIPKIQGWRLHDIIEYVKDAGRLVASRELHVFATFARHFYWSDLNLWPEDLAPGSVVLLSGQDDLMDAAEVKDMLDVAGHVKVYYNRELTHGAFLLDTEVKQTIMAEMRGLLARSGSAVVGLARPVLEHTLTLMHGFTAGGASGRMFIKRSGGAGRYVEDHSNQLVRTFTGNLTKMLASAGGGFRGASSGGGAGLGHVPLAGASSGAAACLGSRSEGGAAAAWMHSKLHGGGITINAAAGGPELQQCSAGGARASGGGACYEHYGVAGSSGRSGGGGDDWSASRLLQTFSGPVRRRFSPGRSAWGVGGDGEEEVSGGGAAGAPLHGGSKGGVLSQLGVARIDEGAEADE